MKATKKVVSAIVRSARMLQKQAGAKHEVTAAMIKAHAGVDLCDKVVRNKLHAEDMWFFRLKERPTLTKQDVKDRLKWARKHLSRSRASWLTMPHAIIDNKTWPVYTNKEGREHAARRCVRGAYQTRGQKPESHVIKPKPQTKFPAKGVQVTAAVINGRIRMWEYLPKRWNRAAAAAVYHGPFSRRCRRRSRPTLRQAGSGPSLKTMIRLVISLAKPSPPSPPWGLAPTICPAAAPV